MDFTREARWVLDGHETLSSIGSTHVGSVSRKNGMIDFPCAALNGMDVFVDGIKTLICKLFHLKSIMQHVVLSLVIKIFVKYH